MNAQHIDLYNGSSWRAVSVPSYLDFPNWVTAFSSTSVWADARQDETFDPELGHWNGKSWTQVITDAPADSFLTDIAGDGAGGLNVLDYERDTGQEYVLHMSSAGSWTRTAIGGGQIESLARVAGTTSVWGAGVLISPYGNDAGIWADGALP
ncbi:MAG TPA: hypothetical protein VH089_27890, partial [Streptosporangiaceae bacterium]|nr:hypothetical protein [Streptosporangiaceae bacterium]